MATVLPGTPENYIQLAQCVLNLMKNNQDHFLKDMSVLFEKGAIDSDNVVIIKEIDKRRGSPIIAKNNDKVYIFEAIDKIDINTIYDLNGTCYEASDPKSTSTRAENILSEATMKLCTDNTKPKNPLISNLKLNINNDRNFQDPKNISNNYFHRESMLRIVKLLYDTAFDELIKRARISPDKCESNAKCPPNGFDIESPTGGKSKTKGKSKIDKIDKTAKIDKKIKAVK
jgi:hypothetical protein